MNLNDLKLKIICERIQIQQEFLNMNHNEQLGYCTITRKKIVEVILLNSVD